MFVRRSVRPLRDCEKKIQIKNIKRKKSQNRYISRIRGGALIQPIAMDVCTSLWVTNVIIRVNFCGCSLRGLVSAKGRIQAFP
jgi:hypothetical protein